MSKGEETTTASPLEDGSLSPVQIAQVPADGVFWGGWVGFVGVDGWGLLGWMGGVCWGGWVGFVGGWMGGVCWGVDG